MQRHPEMKDQQKLLREGVPVEHHQFGVLTFRVRSNKPSQSAIERFGIMFTDLFERSWAEQERDALSA